MRCLKLFASALVIACLTATASFAVTGQEEKKKAGFEHGKCTGFEKDPVKVLEGRKEKVQSMLKEGKITKAEADEITARLEAKIAEMKEFNKLTVQQKKTKLINDFKISIDSKVKEGKLTREEAERAIKKFNEMIAEWDGNGYPMPLHGKGFKGHGKHHLNDKSAIP